MHYLISGIAKSGTTRLFSQLKAALESTGVIPQTFFEPDTDEELTQVLASSKPTLTKVLVGRVSAANDPVAEFQRHVLIYRDPRDQFISMLLYLFYDFQLNNDVAGYEKACNALARKVEAPQDVSTIELYKQIAEGVGRAPIGVFSRLHTIQRTYADHFKPYMLRYEALVEGSALPDLEIYLGMTLQADVEVPSEYARVARSRGYGDWRKWFNAEDLEFTNREWGATIDALGYERETRSGVLSIDPQLSIEYVAQFAPGYEH